MWQPTHRYEVLIQQQLLYAMASNGCHDLHILLFPLMTPGHLIPNVDMAKLFASRGAKVTLLTTTDHAGLLREAITRAEDDSSCGRVGIALVQLPADASVPEREKSPIDLIAYLSTLPAFRDAFQEALRAQRPDCVVADMFFPWCVGIAREYDVPCLIFHGFSNFALGVHYSLYHHDPYEELAEGWESYVIPGLPHRIELPRSKIPDTARCIPFLHHIFKEMDAAELSGFGVIMNSFYELEPEYADHYAKVLGRKTWHIGPLSLSNKGAADEQTKAPSTALPVECSTLMNWLDGREPDSVLYVCFGSMVNFSPAQLLELAAALESANCSFLWVVKQREALPEGYEERVASGGGKGLVIRGWAPQIRILKHPAVGGFMTHCGWNSTLEAISAGVPMATWPFLADQFSNERLVVDVLRTGVAVGAQEYMVNVKEAKLVAGADIARTVNALMAGDEEGESRRRRARELAAMARRAVEHGGSSYEDIGKLMQEIENYRARKELNGQPLNTLHPIE